MEVVKKTGIIERLFPRLPSEVELEARRQENIRQVVRMVGGRAVHNYLTAEDIALRKQQLGIGCCE